MNYQRLYDSIIRGASQHPPIGYSEKHHILPRCLGGINAKTNIVLLTARQHFVAHRLLTKIYPHHAGLWYAFNMMYRSIEGTRNVDPGWVKSVSNSRLFEHHKALRPRHSIETKAKMSAAHKGKILSIETKLRMSAAALLQSKETRRKKSVALKGKKKSPSHIQNMIAHKMKRWCLRTPTQEYIITNLRQFCRDNQLDQGAMIRLSTGKVHRHKDFVYCAVLT